MKKILIFSFLVFSFLLVNNVDASAVCRVPIIEGVCCEQYTSCIQFDWGACVGGMPIIGGNCFCFEPSRACSVKTSCSAGETGIFKMSDLTNAHAGDLSSSYPYVVCCSGVGNSCAGNYDIVLKLSDTDNAHVGYKGSSYSTSICISSEETSVDCIYSSSCPADYACLASVSSTDPQFTNAHVGDCNAYTNKVCCRTYSLGFKRLFISGSLEYFNVFWETAQSPMTMVVDCYLNDVFGCSWTGTAGLGSCSINNPNYVINKNFAPNNISCKVSDACSPGLYNWRNETFYPVAFTVTMPPTIKATVGRTQEVPVTVKNIGLLADNYSINVTAIQPNLVYVVHGYGLTDNLFGNYYNGINQSKTMPASLKVLTNILATNVNITVKSKFGVSESKEIIIRSEDASLPEFDSYGILQIMIISLLVVGSKFYLRKK